jgi:hypothetical protein
MLYWALNNENVKIAWVSPVYRQSKKVFRETIKGFRKRPEIFKQINNSDLMLEFRTGSSITFFSATQYDNIRGETFDFLICDEFAFMDGRAWDEVLRATVLVKGRKVLLISTPNGKNKFYHLHQFDGVNNNYKSFTMTSYDNPMILSSEIDDAKATLPDHVFRQEYLAEFIDGGSGMFSDLQVKQNAERTNRMYAGLDIARADDYTALAIYNEFGEMVFIGRWNHDTWNNIVAKVVALINEYNCHTYVEVNGVGDPIFEQVKNQVEDSNLIQPWVTTNRSKQEIIEQLVVANQRKEVTFTNDEWLHKELGLYTYIYNPKSKNVSYGAPQGFHDDGVMCSAIGYNAYKKLKAVGHYVYG